MSAVECMICQMPRNCQVSNVVAENYRGSWFLLESDIIPCFWEELPSRLFFKWSNVIFYCPNKKIKSLCETAKWKRQSREVSKHVLLLTLSLTAVLCIFSHSSRSHETPLRKRLSEIEHKSNVCMSVRPPKQVLPKHSQTERYCWDSTLLL